MSRIFGRGWCGNRGFRQYALSVVTHPGLKHGHTSLLRDPAWLCIHVGSNRLGTLGWRWLFGLALGTDLHTLDLRSGRLGDRDALPTELIVALVLMGILEHMYPLGD